MFFFVFFVCLPLFIPHPPDTLEIYTGASKERERVSVPALLLVAPLINGDSAQRDKLQKSGRAKKRRTPETLQKMFCKGRKSTLRTSSSTLVMEISFATPATFASSSPLFSLSPDPVSILINAFFPPKKYYYTVQGRT